MVTGVHGVRGAVKIALETEFIERFGKGLELRIGNEKYRSAGYRIQKSQLILQLHGLEDREAAKLLVGSRVFGESELVVELDERSFMVEELIGLRVVDQNGNELGILDAVLPAPAHDVYQVGDILIPAVREFVLDVDLESKVMRVNIIPGMLE